jgi:ArsR family transcriptional regulator, virulence genes transcriptional regulator
MTFSKEDKQKYIRNSEIYKVLANPIRLQILDILKKGETSVADIIKELNLRKANVSQHLSLLRYASLIIPRRDGLTVYYKMTQPKVLDANKIIEKLAD